MTAHLIRGDARRLPLATGSVQCIVTSPPYHSLRSYQTTPVIWDGRDGCEHEWTEGHRVKAQTGGTGPASVKQGTHKGNNGTGFAITAGSCLLCGAMRCELGSEPTVADFIRHLIEVFRECRRVLRDDGCLFINCGDSYGGSGKGPTGHNGLGDQGKRQGFHDQVSAGRPKSLLLVPERLAIALSDDGWVIRSRIAWIKAAPMPESVRDRPTSAWEHIWMLTKRPKYYWDADAVREKAVNITQARNSANGLGNGELAPDRHFGTPDQQRNLWNYWGPISPDPYPGAHFATFPREIPRRCILAATSEYGACKACGAPWRRVVERGNSEHHHRPGCGHQDIDFRDGWDNGKYGGFTNTANVTNQWQPTCRCGPGAGVRPCVVLDPFSGSGTTSFVAASMGRLGVGVELSEQYVDQTRYGRLAQEFLPL